MKSYYSILGVHRGSTPLDIKARWRQLAREMHPDRHGGTPEANAAFAEITEAYAALSEDLRRKAYDKSLEFITDPCLKCEGSGAQRKQAGFVRALVSACPACNGCGRIPRSSPIGTIRKGKVK